MRRPESFKTKLWLYFVLFTAIVFTVLWLAQTVFLQSFYNRMLIRNTNAAAERIVNAASSEDITALIDEIARENSLLVYITDTDGFPLYSSDAYRDAHVRKNIDEINGIQNVKGNVKKRKTDDPGDTYRSLPDNYAAFLETLESSGTGTVEYVDGDVYVCGTFINLIETDETSVLYVAATLDPVGAAVTIIRVQLAAVTVFSLAVGSVLAWFIARRFAVPVGRLSDKAERLGEDGYDSGFPKGFCAELDELSDKLDETSDKLQQSRSFQNELLANVSHDLRTPLTMIRGYAEEVGEYSWSDEAQRKADIGVIIRETDRLTALVNEIMEYSELQAEDVTRDFQSVDLSALTERVTETFDSLYRRSGYTIAREIEPGLTVTGSAPKLERAVVNLLDNAVRHAGENKTVRVCLKRANGIRLEVSDDGKGIDAETLPNIWEKYFTSRQRGNQGVSGLGLPIVRQIAVLHHADYGVDTEEQKGSTFWIRFPSSCD